MFEDNSYRSVTLSKADIDTDDIRRVTRRILVMIHPSAVVCMNVCYMFECTKICMYVSMYVSPISYLHS